MQVSDIMAPDVKYVVGDMNGGLRCANPPYELKSEGPTSKSAKRRQKQSRFGMLEVAN
jgi:hypothetical protein